MELVAYTPMDMEGETLEAALLRSVRAAADTGDLDEAIIETARRYAQAIDATENAVRVCKECGAEAVPDPTARTKALYLGPHFVNALREMGLTPAARNQSKPSEKVDPRDEALDELENRRGRKRAK